MKKLTFKEFLEQERKREDILRCASGLHDVLESARKINDISLLDNVLKEIIVRNEKLNSIIFNSSVDNQKKINTSVMDSVRKATAMPVIDTSVMDSFHKGVAASYKSLSNSISPISKIYSSELEKIKSTAETIGLKNIVKSEAFIEAKNVQNEIVRIEPNIDIRPITTLEKSIESNDPSAFERAANDINTIEKTEQIRVSISNIPLQDKNPAKNSQIDFLIVTGLQAELIIFCEVFGVSSRWFSNKFVSTEYYFAVVKSNCRSYSVALACGQDMGNLYAAQLTNAAIEDLNPKVVISAGMGYSLNPNKLQLCDLHITDTILHWALTSKEYESAGRKVRTAPVQVKSRHLFSEVAKYVNGFRTGKTPYKDWENDSECEQPAISESKIDEVLSSINDAIKCGIPKKIFNRKPKVEIGKTMVSDDAVIASIKEIQNRSHSGVGDENNISGEMEAAGIAMALANRRSSIEFIAIRGICDFGVGKEALEDSSRDFRNIAALRAATFIRSFIESDPTLPKPDRGKSRELGKKEK